MLIHPSLRHSGSVARTALSVGFRRILSSAALCLLVSLATEASAQPLAQPSDKPGLAKMPLAMCISDVAIPPFTYPDREGLSQILLRRAAQAQGLGVKFVAEPSRRCLYDVRKGASNGVPLLGYNAASQGQYAYPQRDGMVDVSRSSASTDFVFVARKGSRVRWDGKQLSGNNSPVMVPSGAITNEAWLVSQGIPFDSNVATVKQIGQMIAAERVDVVLLQQMEAERLHQHPELVGQLQTLTPVAVTVTGYAVFNREFAEANRPLVEAIWNEIGRIRASTEWKSFAEKFERDVLSGAERVSGSVPARQ